MIFFYFYLTFILSKARLIHYTTLLTNQDNCLHVQLQLTQNMCFKLRSAFTFLWSYTVSVSLAQQSQPL